MQKILLIVNFLYVSLNVHAHHTDSLPSNETLFASLRAYHEAQTNSRTAEFQIAEKNSWMKYLPSVGLGYALGTKNGQLTQQLRPNLNFSISQIYNAANDKELRRAKIAAIKLYSEVEFKTDSLNLLIALKRVAIVRNAADELQAAQAIDDELFKLSQQAYDEKKVSTFQHLSEKRQYFERRERISVKAEQLQLLEIEALRAAKW